MLPFLPRGKSILGGFGASDGSVPPNTHLYQPGASASERLQKFVEAIAPLTNPAANGRLLREETFKASDGNGNGLLSLAEVEMFVSETMRQKYGMKEGLRIFLAYVKSTRRAFAAAKAVDPKHSRDVLEGTSCATTDDYVSFSEFRILCAYLCAFAGMQDAYKVIDSGAPSPLSGRGSERNRKVSYQEWMANYKLVAEHGFDVLSNISDDEQAMAIFKEIDVDDSGIIGIHEWYAYVEQKEMDSSTEVGKLLALRRREDKAEEESTTETSITETSTTEEVSERSPTEDTPEASAPKDMQLDGPDQPEEQTSEKPEDQLETETRAVTDELQESVEACKEKAKELEETAQSIVDDQVSAATSKAQEICEVVTSELASEKEETEEALQAKTTELLDAANETKASLEQAGREKAEEAKEMAKSLKDEGSKATDAALENVRKQQEELQGKVDVALESAKLKQEEAKQKAAALMETAATTKTSFFGAIREDAIKNSVVGEKKADGEGDEQKTDRSLDVVSRDLPLSAFGENDSKNKSEKMEESDKACCLGILPPALLKLLRPVDAGKFQDKED